VSRVAVIGATGHVGTYLVPRLVRAGYDVVAASRGEREPYTPAAEWRAVERVRLDREAADAAERIAALGADVVIDMICFTPESAQQLVDALRPTRPLLVHCGTIWVHGAALRVPITEDEPRTAFGDYGVAKAEIEQLLLRETLAGGVPSVILHPGHITGPGWPVITPAGNLDPSTWHKLAHGEPLPLPDLGLGGKERRNLLVSKQSGEQGMVKRGNRHLATSDVEEHRFILSLQVDIQGEGVAASLGDQGRDT